MYEYLTRMKAFKMRARQQLDSFIKTKAIFEIHSLIKEKLSVDEDGLLKPYENQSESKLQEGSLPIRVYQ